MRRTGERSPVGNPRSSSLELPDRSQPLIIRQLSSIRKDNFKKSIFKQLLVLRPVLNDQSCISLEILNARWMSFGPIAQDERFSRGGAVAVKPPQLEARLNEFLYVRNGDGEKPIVDNNSDVASDCVIYLLDENESVSLVIGRYAQITVLALKPGRKRGLSAGWIAGDQKAPGKSIDADHRPSRQLSSDT